MSIYPTGIPTLSDYPDGINDETWVDEAFVNGIRNEVLAICAELGISPSGDAADLAARLGVSLDADGNLKTTLTPTFAGLTLSNMTLGSVLFAGAGGELSQDNAHLFWDDSNDWFGVGTDSPVTLLHLLTPTATELRLETSGAADPTLSFKTTNTAHQMNIFLDESGLNDALRIEGQTAGVDTILKVQGLDGQLAGVMLFSGANNYSSIYMGAGDTLNILNVVEDKDIIFGVNQGGVSRYITWDSSLDKLKHSAGTFNFDDDILTTLGRLGIGVAPTVAKAEINAATAADIGLILKTTDDDLTEALAEWRDSSDAVLGGINSLGHIGAAIAPSATIAVSSRPSYTNQAASGRGMQTVVYVDLASPSTATNYMGLNFTLANGLYGGANVGGSTENHGLFGMNGQVQCWGTSDVYNAYGGVFQVRELGEATIASGGGVKILTPVGDFTRYYAFQNSFADVGSVATYAITSSGGANVFKSGVATIVPLMVGGAAAQSADLFQAENSAHNKLVKIDAQGHVLIETKTDATDVLQVKDSNGNVIFTVNTTDGRVGVNAASPGFALDVVGAANISLDLVARTLRASGDGGAVVGMTSLTNITDTLGLGLGALTLRLGNAGSTHQGWIQVYVGGTRGFVPWFN